jgi:lysophospholipase L1-like esterase
MRLAGARASALVSAGRRRLLPAAALSGLVMTALATGASASAGASAGPGSSAGLWGSGRALGGYPASTAAASTGIHYVALGDSYTAGPLIPDQTGSPVGCLRSDHDYPSLAAAVIHATSFTDVSCQGATTANMTQPQGVGIGTNPPQLNALSPATTLVTLQIGGNDINFADIVINCTTLSFLNPFGSPCKDHYTSGGTDQLKKAIDSTAPKVGAVLRAIHQRAPSARVLLLGYPVIVPNSGHGCWPVVPIAFGDVPYLRGIEIYLNQALAAQAARNGAVFVDTYTDSIGHDFCQAPGVKWVEGLVPTSPAAPVHPNALGERGMAKQVGAAAG